MRTALIFRLGLTAVLTFALFACATPKQPPMPVGNLKLGVAYFTQPEYTGDLLAGYMTDDVQRIDEKVLSDLDGLFSSVLARESKHSFESQESALRCGKKQEQDKKQAAIRRWSAIGRCMGVDILLVPQMLEWRERDGGDYGVVTPAKVVMDIYVLDVHAESLISRSRYDETQSALTSNLLDTGKFIKRGGKWVTARDLAKEGMVKAVKELGL